ncbi:MAG: AMP-binding protein, partial [Candidatus Binatia bacterium]
WIQIEAAGSLSDTLEEFITTLPCRRRLVLDRELTGMNSGALAGYPASDPEVAVEPDDLAYVAFTSGTTGTPKAIQGTHRPLSHFLRWHCEMFDLKETDRFSMLSGLSHDPLLRDIFAPLWLGATLCVPDADDISPDRLADWLNQMEITVSHLTPAMGELLTSDTETIRHQNASLRYVFFGGDVLTRQHVAGVRRLAPAATCVNFYGATETPQAMGRFVVPDQGNSAYDSAPASSKEILPLGQGIEDVQLLVLNASQGLAGVGELGEICVRTPYLAKGYLEDHALTSERFIPNPFTQRPGDRIYRTGDLGRYLPDGTVEFAGRNDRQVKIRGFRVEVEEVEAALGQHPSVRDTVVLAGEDVGGGPSATLGTGKRLVAYVVANQDPPPSISELRRFLKEKLPDYMVPSAFVTLNALPLTPNGKVDRRALPVPNPARPDVEEASVIP